MVINSIICKLNEIGHIEVMPVMYIIRISYNRHHRNVYANELKKKLLQ
jgi:hypothetical protein